LKGYFSKYGTVRDAVVIGDHESGQSRGFGFVNFSAVSEVRAVLNDYHEHFLQGKWVETKCCLPRGRGNNNNTNNNNSHASSQSNHSGGGVPVNLTGSGNGQPPSLLQISPQPRTNFGTPAPSKPTTVEQQQPYSVPGAPPQYC